MTSYRTRRVLDIDVFFREAGDPACPTRLLLPGFPIYIQGYGAPVGTRLATRRPEPWTPWSSRTATNGRGRACLLRDQPDAELHLLPSGRLALAEEVETIARLIRGFYERSGAGGDQYGGQALAGTFWTSSVSA